tara:strand:- start:651 stop:1160 length:510 start_codon:yes stop_codon:yes gene_type:complete
MKKLLLVLAFTFSMNAQIDVVEKGEWETQIKESKNDFGDVTLYAYQTLKVAGFHNDRKLNEVPIKYGNINRLENSIGIMIFSEDERESVFNFNKRNETIKIRNSKGVVTVLNVDNLAYHTSGASVMIFNEYDVKAFNDAVFNCDEYKIIIGKGLETFMIEFTINETNNL